MIVLAIRITLSVLLIYNSDQVLDNEYIQRCQGRFQREGSKRTIEYCTLIYIQLQDRSSSQRKEYKIKKEYSSNYEFLDNHEFAHNNKIHQKWKSIDHYTTHRWIE